MKTNLLIRSKARTIALALLILTAVTASAEIEDRITKSFKVQPGGQLVVAIDRGSIEVRTSGSSPYLEDFKGEIELSRPLVDTPSLAD